MLQQRRMKRLAGPAFYLNVKYDQNQMYKQRNSKLGSDDILDLNNQVGRIPYENFDIKEGELVVTKIDKASRNTKDAYVISSLNGADDLPNTTSDKKAKKLELISKYRFLGVAQTDHVAKKQFEVDQGLVTCVGGVVTVQNDHDGVIYPGQHLVLDIPDKNKPNRGIPRTKRRFCLRPATDKERQQVTGLVESKIEANGGDYMIMNKLTLTIQKLNAVLVSLQKLTTDNGDTQAVYDTQLELVNEVLSDAMVALKPRTNYVAKALSHARPGERLDILLHPRFVA